MIIPETRKAVNRTKYGGLPFTDQNYYHNRKKEFQMKKSYRDYIFLLLAYCMVLGVSAMRVANYLM